MTEFIVENNTSLYSYIKERSFGMSYSRYAGYIKQNKIKVNGKKPALTLKVDKGDSVCIYFKLRAPDLPIIYNDGFLLIIEKPQGLPSNGNYYYTAEKIIIDKFHSAMLCHRLDVGTSGLLIFALTKEVYEYVLSLQTNFGYNKYYRAVVIGAANNNGDTFLTHYLIKNNIESRVGIYDTPARGSQECKLVYRVLKKKDQLSLLEIKLITGRTHQIRAQLDHVGLPILGDDKYGDRKNNKYYNISWPLLQAYKLDFSKVKGDYPFCGRIITLDEPDYIYKLFNHSL